MSFSTIERSIDMTQSQPVVIGQKPSTVQIEIDFHERLNKVDRQLEKLGKSLEENRSSWRSLTVTAAGGVVVGVFIKSLWG